jgi:hypothetical protein
VCRYISFCRKPRCCLYTSFAGACGYVRKSKPALSAFLRDQETRRIVGGAYVGSLPAVEVALAGSL